MFWLRGKLRYILLIDNINIEEKENSLVSPIAYFNFLLTRKHIPDRFDKGFPNFENLTNAILGQPLPNGINYMQILTADE